MAGSAVTALERARELLKGGKYEEAIAPLREALRLVGENPALLNDLGIACLFTRRVPDAVSSFRRSIALRPDGARTHFNLGLALAQSGDYDGALAAHRQAVAIAPDLAEAHGRVGDILMRKGQLAESAAAYARAEAAAPETTYGRLCGAKGLMAEGGAREAEVKLRELIARDESNSEAHLVLANLLSEEGRLDDAAAHFERSIALAPWQTTAYQGLVSSRRLTEGDRPLIARMLARLEGGDLAERQRMMLCFAAGKGLDDVKDYAGAIAQFDAANAIRRKLAPFDRAQCEARVDRLITRFTPDFFAANARLGCDDETPVLVLGMPRSGTTLFERILSSHPRVSGGGELVYWDVHAPSWTVLPTEQLAQASDEMREGYLRVLRGVGAGAAGASRVTDKMPFNFQWVGLVRLLFPKARIVHCRRDPIDTCLSIYMTYFTKDWGFASERANLVFYYRQYLRLMEHWRSVLPADRLLEVDYEEATAAPEETARKLIAFTGLAWDPACLAPERNRDAVRTANKWEARQPVYRSSVERWRKYEAWIGELRELK